MRDEGGKMRQDLRARAAARRNERANFYVCDHDQECEATKSNLRFHPSALIPHPFLPMQPTILIVDDEKHTRDGLRSLLGDKYDTYVAADAASALEVLERDQIDLLLTDLRLGGDD